MSEPEIDRAMLGERLKAARDYLQLSQDVVSRAIGVSRAAISLMESGQRKVEALELRKLAAVYQRSVAYFTGEVLPAALPQEVEHLARAASALSDQDRRELARFAEFLRTKASDERPGK
jgi:transcriptional regulator with XRE-family HTH domain